MFAIRPTVALIAFLLASAAGAAFACSCRFVSPEQNLKSADAVFWGKVTDVDLDGTRRVATIEVGKWFKGGPQKTVKVSTNRGGTACGVSFSQGDSYRVFANARNGKYSTSSCTNTQQMRERPTSATKAAPKRELTKQQKLLSPILRRLGAAARPHCKRGSQFELTFWDNGEFDVDHPNECWQKHIAPKFKAPGLPAGYPFTVLVVLRANEVGLTYRSDGRTPLVRGRMHEELTGRLPLVTREHQMLAYQLLAARGGVNRSLVDLICRLAGEDATRRFLKTASTDGARIDVAKRLYACSVHRRDWARAARLVKEVKKYGPTEFERSVRAQTATLKQASPKLEDLSVSGGDVLNFARKERGWADDVVLLQLIGEALMAQETVPKRDRELAAMAYARAAYLHDPVNTELSKRAVKLGGERIVDEMETLSKQDGMVERAKQRLERLKQEGKVPPPLPK